MGLDAHGIEVEEDWFFGGFLIHFGLGLTEEIFEELVGVAEDHGAPVHITMIRNHQELLLKNIHLLRPLKILINTTKQKSHTLRNFLQTVLNSSLLFEFFNYSVILAKKYVLKI